MEIDNDNDKADDTDNDEDDEMNMEEAFMENQAAMTSSRSQMNDALQIRNEIGTIIKETRRPWTSKLATLSRF